ncbi:MAG: Uma2 family endonuclease [Oculatellaceae cyanobacterium Prado106]|jgi:Uma2 family endonuclease|nr:Uma2 family endonuclease [Oculatellaceae cyanobacterium Prado106]
MVTLQLRQLVMQPGQQIQLQDVNWTEFEAILDELGDRHSTRIAYFEQVLEIRMPLPKHEKAKVLIGDMVKILLEELDIENEGFGSSTFKRADRAAGIEPDECFYIENAAAMIGKERLDLTLDPPPDLAIEVDVTSKTSLSAYQALGVPELWRFEDGCLRISVLHKGQYQDALTSPHFPQIDVVGLVSEGVGRSQTESRSQILKAFRQTIQTLLSKQK